MQVFGGLISPFVRKVCLVAAEKGVEYELVLASPWNPSADFITASPFRKIPAITDGDYHLADSTAIVTYLEAKYPDTPAMLPAEACARGKAMWFDEFTDTILFQSGRKVLFNRFVSPKLMKQPGNEAMALEGEAELPALFAYLEEVVPDEAWLAGDDFSLGDISVASALRSLRYVAMEPAAEDYPRLGAWYARVRERPAWQQIAAVEDAPRRK